MKKKNISLVIVLLAILGLTAQAEITTTVVSSADTGIRSATATYGSDTYMYLFGSATVNNIGYVRFDLSNINIYRVVSASLKMTVSGGAPRNDSFITGRYAPHGLSNITGNTSQNWNEATLNQSNTGLEMNWTTRVLDFTKVVNLDGDVTGITEVSNPAGGSSAAGTTVTTTGTPLVDFINTRVSDGGLVTFIINSEITNSRGYGLATKENATVAYRPELTLTYLPSVADNPQPATGSTVPSASLTQLSWTITQTGIYKCDVYFGTEPNAPDPLKMDKLTFSPTVQSVNITDFPNYDVPLANGTYYWRVDCYNDPNQTASEPNVVGKYWNFTATSVPLVTQQTTPAFQSKFPTPSETATFTAVFSSTTPLTYTWYRSSDNSNSTSADDVVVGTNSNTLNLTNLTLANAGYYYCKAANPSETKSDPARLSIKRQYLYLTLDGNVNDTSGSGLNGTLFGEPNYVAGVNATTGQALEFDGTTDYVREPNDFSDFAPGLTISVWAKPTAAGSFARFIDFGNGAQNENIFFCRNATGANLELGINVGTAASSTVIANNVMVLNEWQMFVTTLDESRNVVLYKNGLPVQTGTIPAMPNIVTRTSNLIGDSNWTADALYAGSMDDIQIWNYPKTADNVADMYSAVAGNFCRTRPTYDWDSTCKVDIGDFMSFAQTWLDCGLYPVCP